MQQLSSLKTMTILDIQKDKVVFFKQGQLPMIDTKEKALIGEDENKTSRQMDMVEYSYQ